MIIYKKDVKGFLRDVNDNRIAEELCDCFRKKMGFVPSENEQRSWANSMQYMGNIVRNSALPPDCGILLEYNLPGSNKRADFIVSGHDKQMRANFVIVELKQWDKAEATDLPNLVRTVLGRGIHETTHPAYQARSYKQFLMDLNAAIEEKNLTPYSCAYLHNYGQHADEPLLAEQYRDAYQDTPIFFKHDNHKLEKYLAKVVGNGAGKEILEQIEHGKIRPSKKFIEYVSEMYAGNPVYNLLDSQQVAFANIMKAARGKKRTTIIVNGEPGTGKSVVAMNAFVALLKEEKNAGAAKIGQESPPEQRHDRIRKLLRHPDGEYRRHHRG